MTVKLAHVFLNIILFLLFIADPIVLNAKPLTSKESM